MSSTPLISVIIPTYNRSQRLASALKSVIAQTYTTFEVIVVDDGSTDDTREAIQQFLNGHADSSSKLRYIFQMNEGPSAARNRGIKEARGEWIAFLDSDDDWSPEKLQLQIECLGHVGAECGACITDARMVNNLGMDTSSFTSFQRPYEKHFGVASDALVSVTKGFCGFWISAMLARAEVVKGIGGFDPEIQCHEDHDFVFRLALATPFAYVNRPLVRTDRSSSPPGSNCRPWDSWQVRLRATQLMYEKWLSLDTLPPDVRATVQRNLRSVHSHWVNWYVAHGQNKEAREAASKALSYEFTYRLAIKWMLARFAPSFARRLMNGRGEDSAVHCR